MSRLLGIDVGTAAVKAAIFETDGAVRASGSAAMPPLEIDGLAAWQDIRAVRHAVDSLVASVVADGGPVARVALTTQRDTVLLLGASGEPITPLISWRDMRERTRGSLWDALAKDGTLRAAASVRSLSSYLVEGWTGRAAEAAGTVPRHLAGTALERLRMILPHELHLPSVATAGAAVGTARGATLHVSGGDKNCELLGNAVLEPGQGALSLGSAISLGMVTGRPGAVTAGTVVTPASLADRWNVETGLAGGLEGYRRFGGAVPGEPCVRPLLEPSLWVLPYLAGALDAPQARLVIQGGGQDPRPEDLFQAWAQGVLGEIRRLRPALEARAGNPLDSLVLSGGGALDTGWGQLTADALATDVRLVQDPWRGARGAVAAALEWEASGTGMAFVRRGTQEGTLCHPDPARAGEVRDYYQVWDALSARERQGERSRGA